MKTGQKKLTIETIVNYCPKCVKTLPKLLKRPTDSVLVARECAKHQTKFVETGTGIKVPRNFLKRFQEITQLEILSSQEI